MRTRLMLDLKVAMKNGDVLTKNTIQMIRAAILQTEIDKKIELDDNGIFEIISKQIKQKNDAIADFEKAGREDLTNQALAEIAILEGYLPTQLSVEEVLEIVKKCKEECGVTDIKGMGTLIKAVKLKVGAASDGKTISEIVRKVLENE